MTRSAFRYLAIGAASAATLVQFAITTPTEAACQQVFVNTTCSGFGPFQKCTNNFRTVCQNAAAPVPILRPGTPALAPGNVAGNLNGGNILHNNGSGVVSDHGLGIVSHNGSALRR